MKLEAGSEIVFVIGSPRSGTSVMAWALAQHEAFATGPETDFLYYLTRGRFAEEAFDVARVRDDGWLAKAGVEKSEFLAAFGLGFDLLLRSRAPGKRWIDQTPACAMVCPQLAAMFPRARFVHMLRDGRATVSSMLASGFDSRIAKDFDFACQTWARCAGDAWAFTRERPDLCIKVRQEDLALDPEATLGKVQGFLGVEPAPAVVAFARKGRLNSSWGNSRPEDVRTHKPESAMAKEPWKSWSSGERARFHKIAGSTMRRVGYDPES